MGIRLCVVKVHTAIGKDYACVDHANQVPIKTILARKAVNHAQMGNKIRLLDLNR